MQSNGVQGGDSGARGGSGGAIKAEDVISKLKEDGDFDRLRRKIIRKFKENEELRESIVSLVKQSAVLNNSGAENMKPRQLSDAIHNEIGDKLMSQVSDGIWSIIRSADGMKKEITETVQSIYNKISNPQGSADGGSSSHIISHPIQIVLENNQDTTSSAKEIDDTLSDGEPNEPPGFGLSDLQRGSSNNLNELENDIDILPSSRKRKATRDIEEGKLAPNDSSEQENFGVPPGFSSFSEHLQSRDASDEDPDVPPGFG